MWIRLRKNGFDKIVNLNLVLMIEQKQLLAGEIPIVSIRLPNNNTVDFDDEFNTVMEALGKNGFDFIDPKS